MHMHQSNQADVGQTLVGISFDNEFHAREFLVAASRLARAGKLKLRPFTGAELVDANLDEAAIERIRDAFAHHDEATIERIRDAFANHVPATPAASDRHSGIRSARPADTNRTWHR